MDAYGTARLAAKDARNLHGIGDGIGVGFLLNGLLFAALIAVVIGFAVNSSGDDDDSPSRPNPAVIQPAVNVPVGRDLDCADIGHEVAVGGYDPNYLDADNDGVGCEGW